MNVEVKDLVEFQVGDMFVSDEGYGYILHQKEDVFILYNLCGSSYWVERGSKEEIDDALKRAVKTGALTHYPKDSFKIVIEKINKGDGE